MLQIFQTRIEIEPIAVRLAAPHLPREELLAPSAASSKERPLIYRTDSDWTPPCTCSSSEHCGNRYIIDMMHRIFDENTRVIISSKQNQVQM